jgi:hypothetical protein
MDSTIEQDLERVRALAMRIADHRNELLQAGRRMIAELTLREDVHLDGALGDAFTALCEVVGKRL